jgi:hypothetical protein
MRNSPIYDTLEQQGENGVWAGGKYSKTLEKQGVLLRRAEKDAARTFVEDTKP